MRLDWLEDIIAVIETGSFSEAAARRFVTQPAFSRRIRAIEEYVGAELFDRERKPVGLKSSISAHQDEIRRVVTQTKDLLYELRRQSRETHDRIVIVSQHAITATLAPKIVRTLTDLLAISVRLRSVNRDECLALLMTKQADLAMSYLSSAEASAEADGFVERVVLGTERLIPVFPPDGRVLLDNSGARGELPIVAYPSEAFLGSIFNEEILPRLPQRDFVLRKAETALTFAALELAVNAVGVAWVPESLAHGPVRHGALANLADVLPSATLTIAALRLAGEHSSAEDFLWNEVLVRME